MNLRTLLKSNWPLLWFAGYGAGIYCALKYETDWTAIQTWAVILTGVVLIWYTWETRSLRRIAFSQRELQLRPFIVFRKEAEKYVVENIGNGAALDVRIESIKLDSNSGLQIEIQFPHSLPLLKQASVGEVAVDVYMNGKKCDPVFAAHLDPKYAVLDVDVRINFSNIEGKQYSLVEIISPQTYSVKGFRGKGAH